MPIPITKLQIERPDLRSIRSFLFFVFLFQAATFAQVGKVEPLPAFADSAVSGSIRETLEPKGFRVLTDANAPVLEIWYRKAIPAQPKPASSDAIYDRLSESTLVGVLRSGKPFQDYRGQSIAPGTYTLRYALMPNDGNHLGVAPSRDFVLLIPAAMDPGVEKTLKFDELVALSRKASGTRHPAPLNLVQTESNGELSKDEEGHVIFTTSVHLSSGEGMTISLVVKGTAPQ